MVRENKSPGKSPADLISPHDDLADLTEKVQSCRGCDAYEHATQAVFGEGAPRARIMLIGEQPGNREDLEGHPFVGPAGALLSKALEQSGIDRAQVYITNVVKHFNSTRRGKLRIHKKPNAGQITACRPWLEAEIALVKPEVIICLGATAAQALIARDYRVSGQRGQLLRSDLSPMITATVHPSSILRAPDDARRHSEMQRFVTDLKTIAAALRSHDRHESIAP